MKKPTSTTHDWVEMRSIFARERTRVTVEECQNLGCEEVRVNGVTNTVADTLYAEVEELFLAGILDEPDLDDDEDPRRPMWDAYVAYSRAVKVQR